MQWQTQAENITTNFKVKLNLNLPAFSVPNIVMCKCCVDDSARCRYNMILVRYLLTELGLNLKFSEHVIEADYGPFIGSTAPMVVVVVFNTGHLSMRFF